MKLALCHINCLKVIGPFAVLIYRLIQDYIRLSKNQRIDKPPASIEMLFEGGRQPRQNQKQGTLEFIIPEKLADFACATSAQPLRIVA